MQLDGDMPTDFEILQPDVGDIPGDHYLRSTPETVLWGRLPCETDAAVLRIRSGQSVTIDTVSHEGILEDHGKDPLGYFTGQGVDAARRCSRTRSRSPRRCRAILPSTGRTS